MTILFKHEIKSESKISPNEIIDLILKERKIKDIKSFLNPPLPETIRLTDFGSKYSKQIHKTLKLLKEIKEKNGMIVVYTDYDADGITGGTILWETLHLLGFKTMPYVPHRKLEGYGFSIKGIDAIKKQFNPALIISVDHGITAREKVSYAKSLGIPIIVTDHHLKPEKLPTDAIAIFHIPELSGSGVAYVFAKEIFKRFSHLTPNSYLLTSNFQIDYPALAAIGTIADLVPLSGPSRSIVKYGLAAIQKTKRVGIKAILQEAGIDGKPISPYEVGFMIAPRINAVGRLEHALDALRLLCTNDHKKAHQLAKKIGGLNKNRQDIVEQSVNQATNVIGYLLSANREKAKQANFYSATCVESLVQEKDFLALASNKNLSASDKILPKIIILISKTWHEGIIGLIASKIAETYYRPTIVITKVDDLPAGREGFYKGSARSFPYFHITNFLRDHKKYLLDVGGHAGASGFTIEENKLNDFVTIVHKSSEKLIKDKDWERKITADIKIPLSKINIDLAKQIEKLAPFGIGNPQPVFYSIGELVDAKIIGKTAKHMRLFFQEPPNTYRLTPNNFQIEFISFNSADKFSSLSKGQKMEIVYQLEVNRWGGKEKIVGKILFL